MVKLVFKFYDENTEKYFIDVELNCTENDYYDYIESIYQDFIYPLETTYGVHDFSGGSTKDRSIKYVGYTSYEIKKKDLDTVKKLWLNKLDYLIKK